MKSMMTFAFQKNLARLCLFAALSGFAWPNVARAALNVTSVSVAAQSGSVTYGTAGSVTFSVTPNGNGNGTMTVAVTGLPAGATYSPTSVSSQNAGNPFTLTVTTVSTTPAVSAQSFTVTCTGANGGASGNGSLTITTRPITVTAASNTKTYDGTTSAAATPSLTSGTLASGDTATYSETYDNRNMGSGKTLTPAAAITNASSVDVTANYNVTAVNNTAGVINAKALTITGVTASARVYDGTTVAPLGGTAALLTAEAAGTGDTSDGKPYTVDSVSAGGTPAGAFADRHVLGGKSVTVTGVTITGTGNGNYTATQPTGLTADVTAKALTVSGLSVPASKVYDGTPTGVVSGTATLQGTEPAGTGSTSDGKPYDVDSVSLTGTPTGTYDSANVASATTVTFGGLSLTGTGNGNYTITAPTQAATITAASSSTAVTASANPSPTGSSVTLSATVTPQIGGTPSGTVQFKDGGSNLGSPATLSGGVGTLATSALSHGTHTITADYGGDGNFNGSSGGMASPLTINLAPVASLATYARSNGTALRIQIANLLATFTSDGDSDARTLVWVGSSTNGATINTNGAFIFYVPTGPDPNTTDHFDYAVTDGYPGGTVTNKVRVTVAGVAVSVSELTITDVGGNKQITFSGIPTYAYRVQRATAVEGPWLDLSTNIVNSIGIGQYTDTSPPGGGAYYRTVWP